MASTYPITGKEDLTFVLENSEKSAIKYSIEKPNLFNFVKLSTIFFPKLCGPKSSWIVNFNMLLGKNKLSGPEKFQY